MKTTMSMMTMPRPKQISDNLLIPTPTPETTEMVAIAVMHQMMITWFSVLTSMLSLMKFRPGMDENSVVTRVEVFNQRIKNQNYLC